MSEYRRATEPLNPEAVKAANAAVSDETGGRRLTMGPEDAELRKKWMDAYIAAGGEYKVVKPSGKSPKDPNAHCPPKGKIKLVELVEVVRQDKEKWVSGAGMNTTKIAKSIGRTAKDGADYKQYINLDRDLEGQNKRYPDCGRLIELKARVEWENKPTKTEGLGGHTVYFSSELTKGNKRPAAMHNDETEGFESGASPQTLADGWTPVLQFRLSMYSGDKFKIFAGLKPKAKDLRTANYVVWRKFWYQMTLFTGKTAPGIQKSIDAYKDVFAEMVAAATSVVNYTKVKLEAKELGIAKCTVYPKYACVVNDNTGADTIVIGRHNEKVTRQFLNAAPKNEPVKMHFMMCDCQWDPEGDTGALQKDVPDGKSRLLVSLANVVIIKPALKGNLLIGTGTWHGLAADKNTENGNTGNIDESWIEIPKPRTSLGEFNIVVPPGIIGKSTGGGIRVKFKLAKAGEYLGDSDGYQITVVMGRADTPATCSHETGHAFYQAPSYTTDAANLPKSFNAAEKATLKVYQDAGWHCSHNATAYGTIYQSGDCVMATRTNVADRKYCELCQPFIKLQDMSSAKVKNPKR
jgi:hypothetical protein